MSTIPKKHIKTPDGYIIPPQGEMWMIRKYDYRSFKDATRFMRDIGVWDQVGWKKWLAKVLEWRTWLDIKALPYVLNFLGLDENTDVGKWIKQALEKYYQQLKSLQENQAIEFYKKLFQNVRSEKSLDDYVIDVKIPIAVHGDLRKQIDKFDKLDQWQKLGVIHFCVTRIYRTAGKMFQFDFSDKVMARTFVTMMVLGLKLHKQEWFSHFGSARKALAGEGVGECFVHLAYEKYVPLHQTAFDKMRSCANFISMFDFSASQAEMENFLKDANDFFEKGKQKKSIDTTQKNFKVAGFSLITAVLGLFLSRR